MNIFVLDEDPAVAARYHCDKHVVKMITESAQLLCSAYYYTDWVLSKPIPYKLSHKNHPCAVWVRESNSNWLWLLSLGLNLYAEYKNRYGQHRTHKAGETLFWLFNNRPELGDNGYTIIPRCMPPEYREGGTVVDAYRRYYNGEKQPILYWTNREVPYWVELQPEAQYY